MLSRRNSLFSSSVDALLRFRPRVLDLERGIVALGLWPKSNAHEQPPRRMQLHDVTNDVLVMIFNLLSVTDVLSMRQVSCVMVRPCLPTEVVFGTGEQVLLRHIPPSDRLEEITAQFRRTYTFPSPNFASFTT